MHCHTASVTTLPYSVVTGAVENFVVKFCNQ